MDEKIKKATSKNVTSTKGEAKKTGKGGRPRGTRVPKIDENERKENLPLEEKTVNAEDSNAISSMVMFPDDFACLMSSCGLAAVDWKMHLASKTWAEQETDEEKKKEYAQNAEFFMDTAIREECSAISYLREITGEEELTVRGARILKKIDDALSPIVIELIRKYCGKKISNLLYDTADKDMMQYIIDSILSSNDDDEELDED